MLSEDIMDPIQMDGVFHILLVTRWTRAATLDDLIMALPPVNLSRERTDCIWCICRENSKLVL